MSNVNQTAADGALSAAGQQLAAELTAQLAELQARLQETADGAATAGKALADAFETPQPALTALAGKIGQLFTVDKLKKYALALNEIAEEYNTLQLRLAGVGQSTPKFHASLEQIAQVATRTSSNLQDTVSAYAALGQASGKLQVGQAELLRLTETILKANQLTGRTNQEAGNALSQLAAALQNGSLNGSAFNAVLSNSPRIAQALADSLGTSVEALQKMAEEGKLSSETVIQALQSQAGVIDAEFSRLPDTISKALTNLGTNWTTLVGSFDQSLGVTDKLAQGINLVADNLETVATIALYAGEALVAAYAIKGVGALAAFTAQLVTTTTAAGAMTAASNAMTAAMAGMQAVTQRLGVTMKSLGWAAAAVAVVNLGIALYDLHKQYEREKQLQQEAADGAERLKNRFAEISQQTGVTVTSMRELDKAVEDGLIHFDQASASWKAGAASLEVVSGAARRTAESNAELAKAFQAIAQASGLDLSKIGNNANDLAIELARVAQTSDEAAKAIGDHLPAAIEKLSGSDLQQFASTFSLAIARAEGQTTLLEASMIAVAKQAAKSLGVDIPQAFGGMHEAFSQALTNIGTLIRVLPTLEQASVNTGNVLRGAFGKLIDTAQTEAEFDAIGKRINALAAAGQLAKPVVAELFGEMYEKMLLTAQTLPELDRINEKIAGLAQEGKLSADAVRELGDASAEMRKRIEDATPGIQSAEEAFRRLGVTSQAELQRVADGAQEAFDYIRASGTASSEELRQSFTVWAEAAIAANNGVIDASVKTAAAQLGLQVSVSDGGKLVTQTWKEAADATGKFAEKTDEAKGAAEDLSSAVDGAADSMDDVVSRIAQVTRTISVPWLSGADAASKYADEAGKAAQAAVASLQSSGRNLGALLEFGQQVARSYVHTMEELDRREAGLKQGAAKGVDDLKLRLLELNGTEEQIAAARLARDKAEIDRQIAMTQIEVERARLRGDQDEASRLQREISLLREQITLLDQIHKAEQRKRKNDGNSGGGSSSGSGSGASRAQAVIAGGSPTTINAPVTLNVTDANPARLARAIEGELAKLQRLAK